MPRLELVSAALSAKIGYAIRRELEYPIDYEIFWSDSQIVLGYIKNNHKRFKLFVANRVNNIRQLSYPEQWHYVQTKLNPADHASRGITYKDKVKVDQWFNGPSFLWGDLDLTHNVSSFDVKNEDPELKKTQDVCLSTIIKDGKSQLDLVTYFEGKFSSWKKVKRVFAYVLLFVSKLRSRNQSMPIKLQSNDEAANLLTIKQINYAERLFLQALQRKYFKKELKGLRESPSQISSDSQLYQLDPFIDSDDLIRVGGRLHRSSLEFSLKHPIVIPKISRIANLIIQSCHEDMQHGGRGFTMNKVRNDGYWILGLNSLTRRILWRCILCRKLKGKPGVQKMSSLPFDRTEPTAPFTYCGMDLFGPFNIKERRSDLKRYGVIFTCLSCRAVHLECTNSLDTDSFILALRRFISRRGRIRSIRSDNGSNFIGAQNELAKATKEIDRSKVNTFLQTQGCDDIIWKRNPPYGSHFGGVWERQIRTIRRILCNLLQTHSHSLNDESFRTFLCEVEAVINSKPLTVETLNDPNSLLPISPNMLLTMKTRVVPPPPGAFEPSDIYSRRRWRRIQHLVNEFWNRWRKEFLIGLQTRRKWQKKSRNFSVGDIVFLVMEAPRNEWPMGVITKVYPDEFGIVRKVELRTTTNENLLRPISKIVLLIENGWFDSPSEKPNQDPLDL